jgi:hypothetical protein
MDPITGILLPAILPALIDAGKNLAGGISRKIGGLSVDDQIKLQNADIEKLKALALLDDVKGNPSQWVVDTRASFRYIAAGVSIIGGLVLLAKNIQPDIAAQLVSAPFSFIFGERLYMGLTGKGR